MRQRRPPPSSPCPRLPRPRRRPFASAAAAAAVASPSSSHASRSRRRPTMPSKHRLRSPRPQSLLLTLRTLVLVFVAFALVAAPSVDAVRINVASCPTDSRASSSSSRTPQLQWQPVRAEANFEPLTDSYNLQLVVWGNVSGAMNPGALPPADDPYWSDPRRTNGKIVELPDPDNKKATTLIRKVNVLTVERWNERVNFCKDGLVNGTCPLSPVFDVENADLPSVNLSHEFPSSYAFSSFVATMLIIYGDNAKTTIGCMSSTITPDLGSIASVLRFLPFSILVVSALAVILAGLFSPWGSTNIFHWSSNYGRDTDLLRLITPGFGDCLQYIQFVVLTGGLSLAYPGYYQPIVSQAAWSSLMFNQTIITHAYPWQSIVDGIYVTNSTQGYGLHQLGQLVGMALATDIWSGTMVWLCVIIAGVFLLTQACFFLQWLWRKINNISEEDLRAKNIPFSTGNLVRIVLNYMLVPVVALSTFHLVVASSASPYTIALAVVTLALVMLSSTWILAVIIRTRPTSVLFDDLPTVLRFGPLYNTYSDEVAAFALIPVLINSIRGVAIGAVQSSGVAQIVLLAICEVIQVFTIHAFRPFHSATSMNAHHTIFSCLRAITILLMVAFVPSLGVNEGSKAWIGYAILLVHGLVLILGFFLSALQTIVEVAARMLGAGGDNATGLRRGGLSKIFGMRQLSRRETHRPAPSRASQLSTTSILDMEDGGRAGYAMPSGRVRSGSAASLAGMALHHRHRSSSALDSIDMYSAGHRHMNPSVSSYAPGTPGETITFSFLGPATYARHHAPMAAPELSDPYYRPPRRRCETTNDLAYSDVPPDAGGGSGGDDSKRPAPVSGKAAEAGEEAMLRGMTLAPPNPSAMNLPTNRPDYSTREVDFYYGVRGPALNSEGPGRKLGTGPADPTGPVATATGWFRNMFRGKTKETGKGFKVVRSARMPPGMMHNGGFSDETPPEGIPVAMGVLRNGPIDSDDEDEVKASRVKYSSQATPRKRRPTDLLTDSGDAQASDADDETVSPADEEQGARLPVRASSDPLEDQDLGLPVIPCKSSKRNSDSMDRGRLSTTSPVESGTSSPLIAGAAGDEHQPEPSLLPSDLPFARTASRRRASSKSSLELATGIAQGQCERPASYGTVRQHGISRVDPDPSPTNLLSASSAEVVDGGGGSTASATKPC